MLLQEPASRAVLCRPMPCPAAKNTTAMMMIVQHHTKFWFQFKMLETLSTPSTCMPALPHLTELGHGGSIRHVGTMRPLKMLGRRGVTPFLTGHESNSGIKTMASVAAAATHIQEPNHMDLNILRQIFREEAAHMASHWQQQHQLLLAGQQILLQRTADVQDQLAAYQRATDARLDSMSLDIQQQHRTSTASSFLTQTDFSANWEMRGQPSPDVSPHAGDEFLSEWLREAGAAPMETFEPSWVAAASCCATVGSVSGSDEQSMPVQQLQQLHVRVSAPITQNQRPPLSHAEIRKHQAANNPRACLLCHLPFRHTRCAALKHHHTQSHTLLLQT